MATRLGTQRWLSLSYTFIVEGVPSVQMSNAFSESRSSSTIGIVRAGS
jgi:hypothetical protein